MLSLIFTYQDSLYLATEIGALVLVLVLCWLTPNHHRPPQTH
jgi:hypothetical protein